MPTHAENMVEMLQARLLKAGGVTSTSAGGVSTTFSDLKRELEYWEAKVKKEAGERPRMLSPTMGGP